MRFFNTAGPVRCQKHYCLPPLERFNLDEIISLIDQEKYFVLHAPRQTGKTSSLLALMKYLNTGDKYSCLYCNVESAQAARENVKEAIQAILNELGSQARYILKDAFVDSVWPDILKRSGGYTALNEVLTRWAEKNTKPLVILMDEIDSLIGDTLISVLRQLRKRSINPIFSGHQIRAIISQLLHLRRLIQLWQINYRNKIRIRNGGNFGRHI